MSHLPFWEREGMTYGEYVSRNGRRMNRTIELVREGLSPHEAAKRAIEEIPK